MYKAILRIIVSIVEAVISVEFLYDSGNSTKVSQMVCGQIHSAGMGCGEAPTVAAISVPHPVNSLNGAWFRIDEYG